MSKVVTTRPLSPKAGSENTVPKMLILGYDMVGYNLLEALEGPPSTDLSQSHDVSYANRAIGSICEECIASRP